MSTPHSYTIGGVKVHFPVKAYPSQIAMMNKIICALQRGQNSLLESPTGSGKSLALLCAALAWQEAEREKAEAYNRAVENGDIEPEYTNNHEDDDADDLNPEVAARVQDGSAGGGFIPDDEDFQSPPNKRNRGETDDNGAALNGNGLPTAVQLLPRKIKKKKVPKIYFGTRTHKQISQIIRELRKTAYKDVRMTILGSRDHTCIHPSVSKLRNKNEGCKELMDYNKGGGCSFQQNVKRRCASHSAIWNYRNSKEAWDLEDLVTVGKKVKACPYYITRELKMTAQIIFCPYNYLVEPMIRKSMEISLKGQILILDEAHNIEDSARSAASWQVTQDEIQDAMQDCEKMVTLGILPDSHKALAQVCSQLSTWIDLHKNHLGDYTDFNSASKVWNGTEIIAEFNVHGIGHMRFGELKKHLEAVVADAQMAAEDREEESAHPKLQSTTTGLLENFFMVLNYLYMKEMLHRDDFRVALVKSQQRRSVKRETGNSWLKKGDRQQTVLGMTFTVNFWCLNPAVTFDELKETVRSIVLTSGTLSPMTSFSSELDVKFPIQLEANHVIDKKQVWISTLSHGPTGHCLNATYKNADSFAFQDEIGRLVNGVCRTVSHGVLLFLPSYKMLDKLIERWQMTGLMDEIGQKKVTIREPRNSEDFEDSIRHFGDVIDATNANSGDGIDGALFIAVCRGKVSEGLDFADNNARAVICVGIPFPNVRDIQVDLKKKYNDQKKKTDMNILSGNDWYEIQAFRALNQALGRCIRHRKDWGAIIMVDDRYQRIRRYLNGLSKWVRSGVVHYNHCESMLMRLKEFTIDMKEMQTEAEAEEERKKAETKTNTLADVAAKLQNIKAASEEAVGLRLTNDLFERDPESPLTKAKQITEEAASDSHDERRSSTNTVFPDGKRSPCIEAFFAPRRRVTKDAQKTYPSPGKVNDVILIPESPEKDDDDDVLIVSTPQKQLRSIENLRGRFSFPPVAPETSKAGDDGDIVRKMHTAKKTTPSRGNAGKRKQQDKKPITYVGDSDDDFQ